MCLKTFRMARENEKMKIDNKGDAKKDKEPVIVEDAGGEDVMDIKNDIESDENEAEAPEPKDDRKWYIVQCYTSQEIRVMERIKDIMAQKAWANKLFKVLVPQEETIEIKNNKRTEKTSKIFSGYVFVEALLGDDVIYEIRRLPGVSKFIGSKTRPLPVTEDEILRVLRKVGDKSKKIDIDFEVDEVIKVISGPFRGYTGSISEISAAKGTLKAFISIFGRETPVTLDFNQVEKVIK